MSKGFAARQNSMGNQRLWKHDNSISHSGSEKVQSLPYTDPSSLRLYSDIITYEFTIGLQLGESGHACRKVPAACATAIRTQSTESNELQTRRI